MQAMHAKVALFELLALAVSVHGIGEQPVPPGRVSSLAEGWWHLQKLQIGPELHEFPLASKMDGHVVSMQVGVNGSGPLTFATKVVNALRFKATLVPNSESQFPFEALHVKPGPATKMMGPPGMMAAEAALASGFLEVDRWLVDGDKLLIQGHTVEMTFSKAGGGDADSYQLLGNEQHVSKIDDIHNLRARLRLNGESYEQMAQQVAPPLEELKESQASTGHATFDDVSRMHMPEKHPLPSVMV
jgi:hypothetical protein